uniref:Secreted protein n=1 Tax=Anguilla anguilla TaxID=7936 RepID=A0A0E9X502_ANGAN
MIKRFFIFHNLFGSFFLFLLSQMDYCVLIAKDFPVIKFEFTLKWDENACLSGQNLQRKTARWRCSL